MLLFRLRGFGGRGRDFAGLVLRLSGVALRLAGVVDQRAADFADEPGAFVDVAGVELDEVGAGVEHGAHVVGRHQPAHADDGVVSARAGVDPADDLHGPAGQGGSSEASGPDLVERRAAGPESFAEMRAVRGDDAVEGRFEQDVGHAVDHLVGHVGGYFEHDRAVLVLSAAEVEQRFEDPENVFAGVGRSLPAGVVAADVDGEVVRILIEVAEEFQIVGRGVLDGRGGVFPDVAPHDNPLVGAAEVADGGFESPVCDSDAADDRLVLREPEDARAGIPGLRLRRDGSDLDESESHGGEFAVGFAVAVESGGEPHGVAELHAEDLAFERRVLDGAALVQQPAAAGNEPDDAQKQQGDPVGPFDGEREEDGLYDSPIHSCAQR